MGCKYVKEFEFGSDKGFSGSAGQTVVKGYARGGKACNHKMAKGGKVLEKATGETYPSKAAMVKHEMMETPRMQKEEMIQKRMVKGPAMAARRDPRAALLQPMAMAKGGKVQAKMTKVMGEFGKGELHSGSKQGPVVKNPKQAVAIAYSEARKAGKK